MTTKKKLPWVPMLRATVVVDTPPKMLRLEINFSESEVFAEKNKLRDANVTNASICSISPKTVKMSCQTVLKTT